MSKPPLAPSLAHLAIEGVVVQPRDAYHPMLFQGGCLRCGGGHLSPGCRSHRLGARVAALRERGLCDYVADLLAETDLAADLASVERLSDAELEQLNAAAGRR